MGENVLTHDRKTQALLLVSMLAVLVVGMLPPWPQDPAYHRFADMRTLFGCPNGFNVFTNFFFIVAGIFGLFTVKKRSTLPVREGYQAQYLFFFGSIVLVGAGSAFYHLRPNNYSLFWDRLPMALAFMALISVVIGEMVNAKMARRLFGPLLLFGVGSVAYWIVTEHYGRGDLRPYILVQFLPMLLIPMILILFPASERYKRNLLLMLVCYGCAKLCEVYDQEIFQAGRIISGHGLKHIVAGLGVFFVASAVRSENTM